MSKLISATLIATALVLTSTNNSDVTLAGTCASRCGTPPIQFTPGQYIRLEVVNRTYSLVKLEKSPGTPPISLEPGQELQFAQGDSLQPNLSVIFWNEKGWPLKAIVSKPNFGTLRVEIRPGRSNPGDRSIYILNDGRVNVL
ncbi:hypothetical protein Cylst_3258 [Cylindrospermum stagnale PCC 7417]|uniref:Uncharacterized protein n=1 Tax=Cylindrospermum stagnale PCC 7417 TaxID=56107 RepID=K9X018_9NOST|nr:hypothetical protein [Cylindrospermum stagnale]AFZ25419.1 hypothetical protein Cylst_3258 [Cylindrospermum stagnale PCC 7417]